MVVETRRIVKRNQREPTYPGLDRPHPFLRVYLTMSL